METDFQVFLGIFVFLVLMWIFFETHYFLQMLITVISSRVFKKRAGVLDQTTYHGICLTTDIDIFFDHMNNSRYLRDIDFARTDFYTRTRLFGKILEKGGKVMVGANLVIYRRPIRPLAGYNITSKIVYWDKKSVFMEHRFVTTRDAVVRASVLSQQRFIDCDADAILREMQEPEAAVESPAMSAEIARLMDVIKATWTSSQYENTLTSNADDPEQIKIESLSVKEDLNANGQTSPRTKSTDNSANGDYIQRC